MRESVCQRMLKDKAKDSHAVGSILENGGSVQHLDFLTQEEKDVFEQVSRSISDG